MFCNIVTNGTKRESPVLRATSDRFSTWGRLFSCRLCS